MQKSHQLFFCLSAIVFIVVIYIIFGVPKDLIVFIYNLLILIFTLFGLALHPTRFYSLSKVVYFFFFFFFGIIPLNDELKKNIYWNFGSLNIASFQLANLYTFIGLLSFFIGNQKTLKFRLLDYPIGYTMNLGFLFYLISSFILFFFAYIILKNADFNLIRLFTRNTPVELLDVDYTSQFNSTSSSIIFESVIKPFPIFYFLLYNFHLKILKERSLFQKTFLFLLFLNCLIFVAPTSLSRFMVGALYIPFIIYFTNIWNKPYALQLTLLLSLFILFPFLNLFRFFNPNDFNLDLIREFDFSFMDSGNFDAYQNFARCIDDNFITYGYQLLGVLLFFVPRSLWPSKPIGSGATLSKIHGQEFGNISMPYIAEGYVNFGLLGVVLFMFFLGVLLNTLDKKYWSSKNMFQNMFSIIYSFLIGMVFFIMRGDLLSSFTYTCGLFISFSISLLLFKKLQNL